MGQRDQKGKYDIVIYDGICTEETIRMIGATSKARFEMLSLSIYSSPHPCTNWKKRKKIRITKRTFDRLYLKYLRSIAEKTDLGRLATPSILRLVDEAMSISRSGSHLSGRTSADIWEALEHMLEVIRFALLWTNMN